jgi:hypothetical protein
MIDGNDDEWLLTILCGKQKADADNKTRKISLA